MMNPGPTTRRRFLKTVLAAGVSTAVIPHRFAFAAPAAIVNPSPARVALTAGEDRVANVFNGLKAFEKELRAAIGNRPIIVKPNNVTIDVQLGATHADCLEGILEFLKSIGRTDKVAIAESAASGPTFEGYENFNYFRLKPKYSVDFVDLDEQGHEIKYVVNDGDFHPHAVRMSRLLLDPETYIISSAVMKTHDRVVATLSLKNIVLGAPIKDKGFRWGRDSAPGAQNDKPITHGGGTKGVNYNLFAFAPILSPDLSVIDGYQGMEGNGPVGGTPVEHRVAVLPSRNTSGRTTCMTTSSGK